MPRNIDRTMRTGRDHDTLPRGPAWNRGRPPGRRAGRGRGARAATLIRSVRAQEAGIDRVESLWLKAHLIWESTPRGDHRRVSRTPAQEGTAHRSGVRPDAGSDMGSILRRF